MSTTFDVIPVETVQITFGQVIERSEKRIGSFLESVGLTHQVKLSVTVHQKQEQYKYIRSVTKEDLFNWQENEYAWFTIDDVAGGTDVYQGLIEDKSIDEENPWWKLEDLVKYNKVIIAIEEKLSKAKKLNQYWWFRRSAGQQGIIALSYGLIAASVAELTQGIIFSDDNAWDFSLFPCEAYTFFENYFYPDKTVENEFKEWAQRCIAGIKEDLEEKE